jgi:hypothetical protein
MHSRAIGASRGSQCRAYANDQGTRLAITLGAAPSAQNMPSPTAAIFQREDTETSTRTWFH